MTDGLPSGPGRPCSARPRPTTQQSLYFGTQSGSFFALADGEEWVEAVRHLPPILSVEVTPWSR